MNLLIQLHDSWCAKKVQQLCCGDIAIGDFGEQREYKRYLDMSLHMIVTKRF